MFNRQGAPAKVEAIDFDGPDSVERRCSSCKSFIGRVAKNVLRPNGTNSMIRQGGKLSCQSCGVENKNV